MFPVLSLWDTDPGSVRSFGYRWSESSHILRIEGETQGFARLGRGRYKTIRTGSSATTHLAVETRATLSDK